MRGAIAACAALRDTVWFASGRSPGSRVDNPGKSPSRLPPIAIAIEGGTVAVDLPYSFTVAGAAPGWLIRNQRTGFPFHFPRSNNNHGKHLKQMSSKLVDEYIGE